VIDAIEALADVGVQHVFRLFAGDVDGCDGVLG